MNSFRSSIQTTLKLGALIAGGVLIVLLIGLEIEKANELNLREIVGLASQISRYLEEGMTESEVSQLIDPLVGEADGYALVALSGGILYPHNGNLSNTDALEAISEYSSERETIRQTSFILDEFKIRYRVVESVEISGNADRLVLVMRDVPALSALRATAILALVLAATPLAISHFVANRVTKEFSYDLALLASRLRNPKTDQVNLSDSLGTYTELHSLAAALEFRGKNRSGELVDVQDMLSLANAVLGQVRDGIVILNQEGRVAMINRTAAALFQASEANAIGSSLAQVVYSHQLVELWSDFIASGVEKSKEITSRQGNRTLFITISSLELGSGNFSILVIQDNTRQRELEAIRRDFISNVSHELRTPIASIKALTETLQTGALNDPAATQRFLARIDIEVDALHHLVTELLSLSRIESGREQFDFQPVNPCDIGRIVVQRMQAQAERGGLKLAIKCDANSPLLLDRNRIEQLLVNLIHNSIKFTEPGGRITLTVVQSGLETEFAISDTGIGIPEGDLPRVFERFYKSDRSRSSGGTGLGLAIAKHIVEGHGGTIRVSSVEGRGTKFTCIFTSRNENH